MPPDLIRQGTAGAAAVIFAAVLAIRLLADLGPDPAPASFPAPRMLQERQKLLFGRKMDLNRAEAEDLVLADGVGPTVARRILEDRRRRGPFRSMDDLDRIDGIGPARLRGLKELFQVGSHFTDDSP